MNDLDAQQDLTPQQPSGTSPSILPGGYVPPVHQPHIPTADELWKRYEDLLKSYSPQWPGRPL